MKKDDELLESLGKKFIAGGTANGYAAEDLAKLYKQIQLFSGYSFNSSHKFVWPIMVTW